MSICHWPALSHERESMTVLWRGMGRTSLIVGIKGNLNQHLCIWSIIRKPVECTLAGKNECSLFPGHYFSKLNQTFGSQFGNINRDFVSGNLSDK
jgi:hypothetical protein